MTYARIENGQIAEYPVYEGDIRLRHPNVSFPTPFAPPSGYEPVADVTPPAYDYRKNVSEGDPLLVGGKWTRNWVVTDASAKELDERIAARWTEVRAERNRRLLDCDWTQLPDAPLSDTDKQAWADYRQELRDITTQADPFGIVWPNTVG